MNWQWYLRVSFKRFVEKMVQLISRFLGVLSTHDRLVSMMDDNASPWHSPLSETRELFLVTDEESRMHFTVGMIAASPLCCHLEIYGSESSWNLVWSPEFLWLTIVASSWRILKTVLSNFGLGSCQKRSLKNFADSRADISVLWPQLSSRYDRSEN